MTGVRMGTDGHVLETLVSFAGIAVLVSVTPGPATALVVRSAALHGRREAMLTTLGNSTGIVLWALASVLGISALVAASETAFTVLKVAGAVVLVLLGLQSIFHSRYGSPVPDAPPPKPRNHYREGLLTSFANPKLAVFFLALFPQFIPEGDPVLPSTVLMALIIVLMDLIWFTIIALVVGRAKRALSEGRWARRMEAASGSVLVALGIRLALISR